MSTRITIEKVDDTTGSTTDRRGVLIPEAFLSAEIGAAVTRWVAQMNREGSQVA